MAGGIEVLLLGLMVAIVVLVSVSNRLGVPYPILLTIGGLGLGFVPGLPEIRLEPDLVLLLFLPVLLFAAAYFSSVRDLRANTRPITLLAVGCVLVTVAGVAVVGHVVAGLSWPTAFVLGAVLGPTDAITVNALASRFGLPSRVQTVLEGESLVNDAPTLTAYGVAVAAVTTGTFSALGAAGSFAAQVAGGVAVGLGVAVVVDAVFKRLRDPQASIAFSLISPYAAYIPAEQLHVSGVLAVVTAGLVTSWRSPVVMDAVMRINGGAVWDLLVFILNALLFLLIGLQLRPLVSDLQNVGVGELIAQAAAVSGAVVVIRFVWVLPATYLPRWLSRRTREQDPLPPFGHIFVIAFSGMRGAVSLAAALAIPLTVDSGGPFPDRDRLVILTFAAVVVTLVGQGLTLPLFAHWLGVDADDLDEREEIAARLAAAEAAIVRVDALADEDWTRDETVARVRALLDYRRRRYVSRREGDDDAAGFAIRTASFSRLQREIIDAQRTALVGMRNDGRISQAVMRRVERDLDLDESRLEEARYAEEHADSLGHPVADTSD